MSNAYEKARTELEKLIAEAQDARRDKVSARTDAAIQALLDYSSDFDDLNNAALDAHDAACIGDLTQAIAAFSKVATEIGKEEGQIKTGLERATKIAQAGKEDLLIPKIAEVSTRVQTELKALKEGIDNLIAEGRGVHNIQGFNNLLPQVIGVLDQVKDTAEAAGLHVDVPANITNVAQTVSVTLTKLDSQRDSLQQFVQAVGNAHDIEDVNNLIPQAIDILDQLKSASASAGVNVGIPDDVSNMAQTVSDTLTELQGQKDSLEHLIQAGGNVHHAQDVLDLLPDAISKLAELEAKAKMAGILAG